MNAREIDDKVPLWLVPNTSSRLSLCLVVLFCLTATAALGGGPPLQFGKMVGGFGGHAVASDSLSNIYVGAGSIGTGNGVDTALAKYDSAGNLLWSFRVTNGGVSIVGIATEGSNAVYVCGDVGQNIRAGAVTNTGDNSMFFAKFTATGSNVFTKLFRNLRPGAKPFARTSDGNFLVSGWQPLGDVFYEGITIAESGNWDPLLFKIDTNGAPVWYRRGTGNLDDYAVRKRQLLLVRWP